jgi:hypothetical protein
MTWADRKREELLAKLSAIERELAFWQAEAREGAVLEKHQSQIERLANQLRPVAEQVSGKIKAADLRTEWPTLEIQVLDLHKVWQFFREKLALRFVGHFRDYLLAADEFAWECYQPAQQALVGAGALDRAQVKEPPLVCFSSVASPFSIPRGVSYLGELAGESPRDQATRAIVDSLPIPVVAVPWYQIQHLPDALVLGHEVGHVVEQDAQIEDHVRELILGAVRDTRERYGTEDDWQRWSSEAFADVYGALCGGPAFVSALSDFLLLPARRQSVGAGDYPPTNVRLALVMAALRAADGLGAAGTGGARKLLDSLEERWKDEGVEIHQANEVPAIAMAIVGSRYYQFGNSRLADVMTFNEKKMWEISRALLNDDPIGRPPVRTLLAAAAWAYAGMPQKYHAADVPSRVLRQVLAIVARGVRETHVMRTSERAKVDALAAAKLHELLVQASVA